MGSYGVMGAVGELRRGRNSPGPASTDHRLAGRMRPESWTFVLVPGVATHEGAVVLVVEQRDRGVRIEPADLVDLVGRDEFAAQRAHQPPAHELVAALAVAVARGLELGAELAAQAGLLLHLAQ